MRGHGAKLSRKMEQALAALVTARNLEEAARSVAISTKTLQRWLKLPEFQKAFRELRLTAFRQSLAKLQHGSLAAATTLLKVMLDPSTPVAVRARCAFYILEATRRGVETEDNEARITELERLADESKRHN
jgi:hypothetical protein